MDQDDAGSAEAELKLLELENQRRQNANLRKELQTRKINWNVVLPLLAAVIGVLPAAYIAAINTSTQLETERLKAETALMVESVRTADKDQGFKNLKFFIQAGKLRDPDHRMVDLIDKGDGPSLPTLSCLSGGPLVWVNTRTGRYHLPGDRWFGSTEEGTFVCRADADRSGMKRAPDDVQ